MKFNPNIPRQAQKNFIDQKVKEFTMNKPKKPGTQNSL